MTIPTNAQPMVIFTLWDNLADKPLAEVADGFVFAHVDDRQPQVTEYLTVDDALDAALRAGGEVKVKRLTKWVTPA